MDVDDLKVMLEKYVTEKKGATHSGVVWLVQSKGSQLSLGKIDTSQSDTLVDVTDQCLSDWIQVSIFREYKTIRLCNFVD